MLTRYLIGHVHVKLFGVLILDMQGSTLTVVRLPGASEMRLRASENGTPLVRSGK